MKQKLEALFRQYNIKNISCDSRKLGEHTAFFALKGKSFDGNEFIHEALKAGAIVFTEGEYRHPPESEATSRHPEGAEGDRKDPGYYKFSGSLRSQVLPQDDGWSLHSLADDGWSLHSLADDDPLFHVPNIRKALALAAGIIYPNLPKNIMAVTGTNGKTSVVSYIYQILGLLGKQAASFGTLGLMSNESFLSESEGSRAKSSDLQDQDARTLLLEPKLKELDPSFHSGSSALNTPDAITFRKILNELALKGIDNVAFEASSHGIHQHRMGDVKVKTAGFTSFSQDHLDYHLTMEEYLRVKLQLFASNLEENAEVVISSEILESEYGKQVRVFLEENKIRYCVIRHPSGTSATGRHPRLRVDDKCGDDTHINITNLASSLTLTEINFEYKGKHYQFSTDIIGSFQATNLLIAVKMLENLGIDFDQIIAVLPKVRAVAGRLERAGKINDDFHIFIDYAHTPDALEKSLSELKKIKHPEGKLYVVFGCGGDRDHPKRYLMGKVAARLANHVIVTDDNPRSEAPARIRADILAGAKGAREIDGREAAIVNTIAKLQKNDILLIAGKGHEDYQIIGAKIFPFSDIEVARGCLRR